jgi:hypothetical protein
MNVSLISARHRNGATSDQSPARPGPGSTSGCEDRSLMATAESMLRAGYEHKQIERAMRRMSPPATGDSGLRASFRSLRSLFACHGRVSRRRSTRSDSTAKGLRGQQAESLVSAADWGRRS